MTSEPAENLPASAAQPQVKPTPKILPYVALLMGVLALSMSSLFIRWSSAPGTMTSFYRMLIASGVLTVILLRARGTAGLKISKKWLWLPLLGGLFSGLDHSVWSTAIGSTRLANATLLNNMAPLWVALFALVIWRMRLGGRFWLGLILALAGAGVVFGHDILSNPHLGWGDLLAIFSSLFYAGYFLVTQRARRTLDTLPYIWLSAIASAVVLLVVNLVSGHSFANYPAQTWFAFIAAGLFSQVVGYFSLVYALGHLPAFIVAPSMVAQPVLTALLAIPLAGEGLSVSQWLGGMITIVGIYLVNISQE